MVVLALVILLLGLVTFFRDSLGIPGFFVGCILTAGGLLLLLVATFGVQ